MQIKRQCALWVAFFIAIIGLAGTPVALAEGEVPVASPGEITEPAASPEPAEPSHTTEPAESDGETGPDGETPEDSDAPTYTVTLEAQTIATNTNLCYETVSPEFAGMVSPPDYYPGELTVEITGQIVIEAGGSLTIGTMSIGSETEPSPVIRGSLQADGLLVVKPGGNLMLKDTALELSGEGLLIVQEPGASVTIQGMVLDEALASWGPPMVDNTFHQPEDQWFEEGTVLTEALLPRTLTTNLQYQGIPQYTEIALQWNLSEYGGQSSGEFVLAGRFVDEQGAELISFRPLTMTVHWYAPEELVVTDAVFMGDTAASAKLELKELPKKATQIGGDVWGEISSDNETWTRWEDFQVRQSDEMIACVFHLPDNTPRYFRVCASNDRWNLYWRSDSFLLPSDDTDDSGGDRGGVISPISPTREPEPIVPIPAQTPTPAPLPTPTPLPTTEPTPTPPPAQTSTPIPAPTSTPTPAATPAPAQTPAPAFASSPPQDAGSASSSGESLSDPPPETDAPSMETSAEPEEPADGIILVNPAPDESDGLSPAAQTLLAASGLAVCAGGGIASALAIKGRFRRR